MLKVIIWHTRRSHWVLKKRVHRYQRGIDKCIHKYIKFEVTQNYTMLVKQMVSGNIIGHNNQSNVTNSYLLKSIISQINTMHLFILPSAFKYH